jgi:hypothetical protein
VNTTLCIDEQDRLGTPVHLQAFHNPQKGTVVMHTVVDTAPADLARALLHGIGFTRSTPGWPGRTPRAQQLASDWTYALEIQRIIVYGAWRLRQSSLDWMQTLQQDLRADVTLITASGFPNTERLRRAAHTEQSLQSLLKSTGPPEPPPTDADELPLRLEETVAPLPAAPMATFLAEAGAALKNKHHFVGVVYTFDRVREWIRKSLRSQPTHETFCDLLDDLLATARSVNDIIIQVRGAQAGALLAGLHAELDLQEICRIAYTRRDTSPHGHDTRTLMQLGVDPRIPAAAALAIATRSSCAALAALLVTDFDPATSAITLDGETSTIPNDLAAPVRAQHRRQTRKGYTHLLATSTRTPAAHWIRELLASRAPQAAAATTRDQALTAYKTAISCHPLDTLDDPAREGRIRLPADSLDRWEEEVGHRGVRGRVGPAGWDRQRTVEEDVQLLHAVILQYGGKIKRGDLYRALEWTAERTQSALEQLQQHLDPLGETITEKLPDYLEARAIDHCDVDRALQTLRARAQARDGLSSTAARILNRLVRAYPDRITALPDEHPDATAQAELCQADIASVADDQIWLDNTVAMTLGNHARHNTYKIRRDVG